jgi:hypothetical protein
MASTPVIEGMAAAMAVQDFAWPDFDWWQAFFAEVGRFPTTWDGLQVVPPPRTLEAEAYLLRKTALFDEWTQMLGQRAHALEHYTRQGLQARIERQHTGQACAVCDSFDAQEAGPELERVPPFHPGCRCVLKAVLTDPTHRRRRTR